MESKPNHSRYRVAFTVTKPVACMALSNSQRPKQIRSTLQHCSSTLCKPLGLRSDQPLESKCCWSKPIFLWWYTSRRISKPTSFSGLFARSIGSTLTCMKRRIWWNWIPTSTRRCRDGISTSKVWSQMVSIRLAIQKIHSKIPSGINCFGRKSNPHCTSRCRR